MPVPPETYPPLAAFGELVPLASLPRAQPREGRAPWEAVQTLTDLRTQCSPLLFGGGAFGHGMYNDDPVLYSDSAVRALRLAFAYGINALDTSPYYYPSEMVLGRALRILRPEYPRDAYFLITKCGRYGPEKKQFDYAPETITSSIHASIERLGATYLDAALLHDVEFVSDQPTLAQEPQGAVLAAQAVGIVCKGAEPRTKDEARRALGIAPDDAATIRGEGDRRVLEAARALFALKDQGVVRNVGISGYPLGELVRISRLVASHPPYRPLDVVLNYSNHTLHADLYPAWRPLFDACPWTDASNPGGAWRGPMLLNASPFSMGLFSDRGPPPWHPANKALKDAVQLAHARAKHAATVTDVPPVTADNVLGYTALTAGLRSAVAPQNRIPTLLGMSNVEEVHTAVQTYRALVAGQPDAPEYAHLGSDQLAQYETLHDQLQSFASMVRTTLHDAHVTDRCWPSPGPDA